MTKKPWAIALAAAAVAATLTGCGGGSSLGADATCQEYRDASSSTRTAIIKDMIARYGAKYGDKDTPAKEAEYKLSITGYCAFNTGDSPVSGIYGNGGEK